MVSRRLWVKCRVRHCRQNLWLVFVIKLGYSFCSSILPRSSMSNINLVSISPHQLDPSSLGGLYDLERFEKKYLAQGDSWFSIGHIPPWSTTNVLQQMVLSRSAVAVNCAHPGMELSHMADTSTEPAFLNLLNGSGNPKLAWKWDAILMSGGGNDLIDADRKSV